MSRASSLPSPFFWSRVFFGAVPGARVFNHTRLPIPFPPAAFLFISLYQMNVFGSRSTDHHHVLEFSGGRQVQAATTSPDNTDVVSTVFSKLCSALQNALGRESAKGETEIERIQGGCLHRTNKQSSAHYDRIAE